MRYPKEYKLGKNIVVLDGIVQRIEFGFLKDRPNYTRHDSWVRLQLKTIDEDGRGFNTPVLLIGVADESKPWLCAESAHIQIKRHDKIRIIGRLKRRAYKSGGVWRSMLEIHAERWLILDKHYKFRTRRKNS